MRGSQAEKAVLLDTMGIIPAHAGLTPCSWQSAAHMRDHPRACGAHFSCAIFSAFIAGSSPRMRGSLKGTRHFYDILGIIPAHAGLTRQHVQQREERWDHPRACGAHLSTLYPGMPFVGSSPRMRGSQQHQRRKDLRRGIIPAHAGLTNLAGSTVSTKRDHPRACGAHIPIATNPYITPGSSPRMRGSRNLAFQQPETVGIIPAHAGLTLVTPYISSSHRDHPRACGAHTMVGSMCS